MIVFLFDLLPVELIHSIFRYLWAHEILQGFSNHSDYIDNILHNYDRYAINLCSMLKNQFDQICHQIQPKQVISLAIVDDNETPDQTALFFSHFDIQQFTNLRSFAIISSDQSIFTKLVLLCKFNNFKSLILPEISQAYWCLFGADVEMILPQLKRLVTNDYPLTKPLKNLQHLTVTHCFSYRLEYLFRQIPNLRSLNITISLDIFPFWSKKIPLMNHLRQLTLRIYYGQLTMGLIHEVLIKMPRLIHLELELKDPIDVIGGEKWKSCVKHLNLDIEESMDIIDGNQWKYLSILKSFQSPFWLEQKRWFVALDDCQSSPCLYTVPRFAPKSITYSLNYRSVACSSTELCLDQFVTTLNLPILRSLTHDFTNVTSLVLETNENLNQNDILPFLRLPHLRSLTFDSLSLLVVLSSELVLQSIRVLNVKSTVSKSHIEKICRLFPQVERLQIMIDDNDTLISLIYGLKYLSISKFIYCHSSSLKVLTREWFLEHSSRLKTMDHFTYQLNDDNVRLWMNVE